MPTRLCAMVAIPFDENNSREQQFKDKGFIKYQCLVKECKQIRIAHSRAPIPNPICGYDKIRTERMKKRYEKMRRLKEGMMTSQVGLVPTEQVDQTPILDKSIIAMIKRYGDARKKWAQAGKPRRSLEDMAYIYDNICGPCSHFTGGSCDICGCRIHKTRYALNKLAWLTEQCADNPPKWIANTPNIKKYQEDQKALEEENKKVGLEMAAMISLQQTGQQKNQPQTPQKKGGCGCGKK